ncbi:uncharacterized protein [Notamacropus eugenii]|uniref:uncharacterized protein n=1 Tax=Notamacropus eugenii TaxID=9315 RepID=UPI003B66BA89
MVPCSCWIPGGNISTRGKQQQQQQQPQQQLRQIAAPGTAAVKSRLSTKPGSVPSILKSHSFTAERQFLASNTVWRFRQGVHLFYQTTMMSSMEDYRVSSVQGCMKTFRPMQNQNAVMSDGDYCQILAPKGLQK